MPDDGQGRHDLANLGELCCIPRNDVHLTLHTAIYVRELSCKRHVLRADALLIGVLVGATLAFMVILVLSVFGPAAITDRHMTLI